MSNDWDDEWEGWEPEQTGSSRARWVAFLVLLIMICMGGMLVLGWQFLMRTGGADLLPESGANSAETDPDLAEPTAIAEATSTPQLAPTATLPGAEVVDTGPAITAVSSGPLGIDADLSDWPDAPTVASPFRVYSADGWDGTMDVTAEWRLAWDANHLYVSAVVADDTHVQTQTGSQVFMGDSLSLQIDTQRAQDLGAVLSEDDFQIELSPGDFGSLPASAYRFRGTADNRMLDAPGARIVVASRPSGNGYIIEAAIPWVDLAVQPVAGMEMGIALNVNDNDTPGSAEQEVMMSHISTREFRNPASWGTLELR